MIDDSLMKFTNRFIHCVTLLALRVWNSDYAIVAICLYMHTSLQIKRTEQSFTKIPDWIAERSHNDSNCVYVNDIWKSNSL